MLKEGSVSHTYTPDHALTLSGSLNKNICNKYIKLYYENIWVLHGICSRHTTCMNVAQILLS